MIRRDNFKHLCVALTGIEVIFAKHDLFIFVPIDEGEKRQDTIFTCRSYCSIDPTQQF